MARWNELDRYDGPWIDVFVLMWEAYTAGTIPVGAVVTDESGRIVARGRNRIFDTAGDGGLGGSRLAHAEVNALLALPSTEIYEACTLYSSLEPCPLCLSAVFAVRVGSVRFAGTDPYAGAHGQLPETADQLAHPISVEGPLEGPGGLLPELLHVAHFLWRRPDGDVVRFYEEKRPDLVALARKLPAPDAGGTLPGVYAAVAAACR
jgi:tRNA(Arg) A34 adenosine deaminase TadA